MTWHPDYDPFLKQLHAAGQSDYEISRNMMDKGFPICRNDVGEARRRLRLRPNVKFAKGGNRYPVANDNCVPPPKERANPLLEAHKWLGRRLTEKSGLYWLDRIPTSLNDIMKETNRIRMIAGADLILYNEAWRP